MIRKILFAVLLSLAIVGCGDDESNRSGGSDFRYIQGSVNHVELRKTLKGVFLLVDSLVPVDLKITVVDGNLDSVASVKAKVLKTTDDSYFKGIGDSYSYTSEPFDYPSNYVKLTYTCLHSDSNYKMEFVQYAAIYNDSTPELNIVEALESERVETLVKEEGFSLDLAKKKAMREIVKVLDAGDKLAQAGENEVPLRMWWIPYLYGKYDVNTSDSAFFDLFVKLRSSVGSEKSLRDYVDEVAIVDTLYSRFKRNVNPWGSEVERFYSNYVTFADVWAGFYGLEACNDSIFGNMVKIINKKSAFKGDSLVCSPNVFEYRSFWRPLCRTELKLGICKKDTIALDDVYYKCDAKSMSWQKFSFMDGVERMYGKCYGSRSGNIHLYDSTLVSCQCNKFGDFCKWNKGIPENDMGNFTKVNYFVKGNVGECTEERESERVAVNNAFYICNSGKWQLTDDRTYYFGVCDSTQDGKRDYEEKLGAFECMYHERKVLTHESEDHRGRTYRIEFIGWEWVEILLPDYFEDACNKDLQDFARVYDGNYYVCDHSAWRTMTDEDLTHVVLDGTMCDSLMEDSVKGVNDVYFVCKNYRWQELNPYESQAYKARLKNNLPADYCDAGPVGTTLFWEKDDMILYGCARVYTGKKYRYLWRGFSYRGESKSIDDHYFMKMHDDAYWESGANLAGGEFTAENVYEVDFRGEKFIFKVTDYSINDDYYGVLNENMVEVGGEKYIWALSGDRILLRRPIGDTSVSMSSIENRSDGFENYFENWMTRIKDESRCFDSTSSSSLPCVADTKGSLNDVFAVRYGKDSYMTFEKAKTVCPSGYHIPDTTEWKTLIENDPRLESPLVVRKRRFAETAYHATHHNLFWTSDVKDENIQYCYEYARSTVDYLPDGLVHDREIVSARVTECPKDLYPLVQVLCVSEE